MYWYHREPTLKDMLSDQVVLAVMEADGVDPQEVEDLLKRVKLSPRCRVGRAGGAEQVFSTTRKGP